MRSVVSGAMTPILTKKHVFTWLQLMLPVKRDRKAGDKTVALSVANLHWYFEPTLLSSFQIDQITVLIGLSTVGVAPKSQLSLHYRSAESEYCS